jgi:6,7-dimethyl-8-ribityllumazine synthase
MASALKNLSEYKADKISGKGYKFGIVVSEWNEEITGSLLNGAVNTLENLGVTTENIYVELVPGAFELPLGAQFVAENYDVDAVICLGCVIKGETPHFDYVCKAAADGILRVSLDTDKPVIFGVLTTDNLQQALDRAGGKHGNKGVEAAVTAVKMVLLSMKVFLKSQDFMPQMDEFDDDGESYPF